MAAQDKAPTDAELKEREQALNAREAELAKREAAAQETNKEVRGEEVAAWMKPDYTGPMTTDMAAWRNARYKQTNKGTECADGFVLGKQGFAVPVPDEKPKTEAKK